MKCRKTVHLLTLIACIALSQHTVASDGGQQKKIGVVAAPKQEPQAGEMPLARSCPTTAIAPIDDELYAAAGIKKQNNKPMLYRIRHANSQSYLFGSIHLGPPLIRRAAPSVALALVRSKVLFVEATPTPAQNQQWQQLSSAEDRNLLRDELGPVLYPRYLELAMQAGLTIDRAQYLRPWAAMLAVGSPPHRGAGLEQSIVMQARVAGLRVVGMQSLGDIAKTLDSLPIADQLSMLRDTLCQAHRLPRYFNQLARLYLQGDPKLLNIFAHWGRDQDPIFERFERAMVQQRNKLFLDKTLHSLKAGGAFVSVGAAHLVGPEGLIQLLRNEGFQVAHQF